MNKDNETTIWLMICVTVLSCVVIICLKDMHASTVENNIRLTTSCECHPSIIEEADLPSCH